MKKNLRLNRLEGKGRHHYIKDFSDIRHFGITSYQGKIKCKLVHHARYSVVVPDQLYLCVGNETLWIQPIFFLAPSLLKIDERKTCRLFIDISFGASLTVEFESDGLISRLSDGSGFYKCQITGPTLLFKYATGSAQILNGVPYLKLFHHTNRKAKESIVGSSEFWTSSWNIQGNKVLSNISYLYLSPINKIHCDDDLEEIAMSSSGYIPLRTDHNLSETPDELLKVYRDSTDNRTHSIPVWVRADHLSPQHVYRHEPIDPPIYYEIVCPLIQRVGVNAGSVVRLNRNTLSPRLPKPSNYIVLGIATTVDGLRAPYDEENTSHVWKIDSLKDTEELIDYWFRNRNSDLFSDLPINLAEFECAEK